MSAVANALRVVEPPGDFDREARLGPGHDPACKRDHILEAVLVHRLREPERSVPVCAVEDDVPVAFRVEPRTDLAHRNVRRARDRARLELPLLTDVDEGRRIVGAEQRSSSLRIDFEDKLAVAGHAPRIILAQ